MEPAEFTDKPRGKFSACVGTEDKVTIHGRGKTENCPIKANKSKILKGQKLK